MKTVKVTTDNIVSIIDVDFDDNKDISERLVVDISKQCTLRGCRQSSKTKADHDRG